MIRKIIIGCTIVISILIGVSFTNVVGYRRVVSGVKESPLFNIRIKKETNTDCENFTYEYLGKRNNINLHIPKRKNEERSIQKIFEHIIETDEKEIRGVNSFLKMNCNDVNIIALKNSFIEWIKHQAAQKKSYYFIRQ